ncbi:MAG: FtsX-like permease family protein [Beijerinckiaceae bacterium]|nr:FtsX-like permease family protein [Beijerinckiaceae bacterium]
MAIVGVSSSARVLSESIAREGQRILGGDVALSLIHREADEAQVTWLRTQGSVSAIATLRAVTRLDGGDSALVEVKAVGSDYPPLGQVVTNPAGDLANLLAQRDGVFGIVGEDALMARLGLKPGARLYLGSLALEFRAQLVSEPDKLAGGFSLGPRALISQDALAQTGLIQPGSLVRWTYRVLLPGTATSPAASGERVDQFVSDVEKRFPDAGWQLRTRANVSPQFTRNLERMSQFLTLVGLTALIVGGVGVANAVRGYVDRRTPDIATLKSLGATGRYVFAATLLEVMMATAAGVAIGAAVGVAIPFAVAAFAGPLIPIPFTPELYPGEALSGILFGFLTALTFSLIPLGRTHDLAVSALYRDRVEALNRRPRIEYILMTALAAAALVGSALLLSNEKRLTLTYLVATAGGFVLLRLVGFLIVWLARKAPHAKWTELRLAIANIHRPGAVTYAVVLSLGLGLALLVTLTMIDRNIRTQLQEGLPGQTPSFFFVDVPSREADAFEAFVRSNAADATIERVPFIRGRLVRVNETPAEQVNAKENAAWVLEGDRGVTYSQTVPAGSALAQGEWWPADYTGPPLVSMEADVAAGIGVGLGDSVTLNVMGRNITAKVANLRSVNWRSMGINFVFVFSPNTFAGAPHMFLATAAFPDGGGNERELTLLRKVAQAFPTVTTIRVKDTLEAVAKITDQLAFAIRGATSVALLAAVLVLAGAIAAGQRARIYDAVVLKTLGATRWRLMLAYLLEYGLLGLATAVFAILAGALAASAIVTKVMRLDHFVWDWSSAAQAAGIALAITLTLGLVGTWRVLGQKPARRLRDL